MRRFMRQLTSKAADLRNTRVLFVLGGPGSGKGTQCDKIVDKYGFTYLSSGDLLRAEMESGSEKGENLAKIMGEGHLVSVETVFPLIKEAITRHAGSTHGFIIDGFPREVEQGVRFENEITDVEHVLYFDAGDDVLMKRLLKRAEIGGRHDDNTETIKKRLKTFHERTKPVIEYYRKQGKVCQIHAERSVDEIFTEVQKFLDT